MPIRPDRDTLNRLRLACLTALAILAVVPLAEIAHGALIGDHGGDAAEENMSQEREANRIDYIEIPVADVQRAKTFYGDVFGWTFVDYGPDYASFSDGRLDGGFRKDEDGGKGGPLLVFYDPKLEDKEAKIKASGGKIVKAIFEFPGGRRFHFLDSEGNELAVWSDK